MKNVRRYILIGLVTLSFSAISAQDFSSAHVFAHNDYAGDKPFHTAYDLRVGYIEVDVFLLDGDLMVAHQRNEIRAGRTLEELYLHPLTKQVVANDGFA